MFIWPPIFVPIPFYIQFYLTNEELAFDVDCWRIEFNVSRKIHNPQKMAAQQANRRPRCRTITTTKLAFKIDELAFKIAMNFLRPNVQQTVLRTFPGVIIHLFFKIFLQKQSTDSMRLYFVNLLLLSQFIFTHKFLILIVSFKLNAFVRSFFFVVAVDL